MRKSWLTTALVLGMAAPAAQATGLLIEVDGGVTGTITIDLLEDVAPGHVEQITALVEEGAYDGIVFHRVIDGFMAQTGDVEFGRMGEGFDIRMAGRGGSDRQRRADRPAARSFPERRAEPPGPGVGPPRHCADPEAPECAGSDPAPGARSALFGFPDDASPR